MKNIPLGEKAPEEINVVIEISKGSHNKYEYDEATGAFKLDRVLFAPHFYPLDYGFIPETRSEDGDHLDVLVLGSDPLFPGCVVSVRPVGVMDMVDGGEPDAKILAVQVKNPRTNTLKTLNDIEAAHPHLLKEIANFFETYKQLEGKQVVVKGWKNELNAQEEIKKAREVYAKE